MKTTKKILISLLSVFMAGGLFLGTKSVSSTPVRAEEGSLDGTGFYTYFETCFNNPKSFYGTDSPEDIGIKITIAYEGGNIFWGKANPEAAYTSDIWLGDHRTTGYGVDDNEGHNMADYLYVNGVSYQKICNDNQSGVTNYMGKDGDTVIIEPALDGQFAPVSFHLTGGTLQFYVVGNYLLDTGHTAHDTVLEIKAGCPFRDSEGKLYTLSCDIIGNMPVAGVGEKQYFARKVADATTYQIRDTTGFAPLGDNGVYFVMWFDKYFTAYAGNYILDHYMNFAGHFYLNGKSFEQWCADTDSSSWNFNGVSPIPTNYVYNRPVHMLVDGGNQSAIYFRIHNNLWNTFEVGSKITLEVKEGFVFNDGQGGAHYQSEDTGVTIIKTATGISYYSASVYEDNDMSATGIGTLTTETSLYSYVDVALDVKFAYVTTYETFDGNCSPDHFNSQVKNYVKVNGLTVAAINSSTDTTGYDFSTRFPQNADSTYAKPILTCAINDELNSSIRVLFHNDYLKSLGDEITITLVQGLSILDAWNYTSIAKYSVDAQYTLKETYEAKVANLDFDDMAVEAFVNTYLHFGDVSVENTADTGACAGEEGYYTLAKTALLNLTAAQRLIFASATKYANAYARLQAWAIANGETISISETGTVSSNNTMSINGLTNNNYSMIIVIAAIALVSAAGLVLFLKKRKHN